MNILLSTILCVIHLPLTLKNNFFLFILPPPLKGSLCIQYATMRMEYRCRVCLSRMHSGSRCWCEPEAILQDKVNHEVWCRVWMLQWNSVCFSAKTELQPWFEWRNSIAAWLPMCCVIWAVIAEMRRKGHYSICVSILLEYIHAGHIAAAVTSTQRLRGILWNISYHGRLWKVFFFFFFK